jgi:hypothetical protein
MADKKISALTGATTPLDGTEVLPIVQSGATVKVANNDLRPKQIQSNATSGVLQVAGPASAATRVMTVPDANFTAARIDAAQSFAGDQTFSTGNLVFGTASKGIFGSSPFSVAIANGAAGTILDLSVAMPAGSTGIVNVYGASAGKATILCQRDQGGYYSVTELGTQPRGTYITSISLSGTNLRITNSSGGAETFSGRITLMI